MRGHAGFRRRAAGGRSSASETSQMNQISDGVISSQQVDLYRLKRFTRLNISMHLIDEFVAPLRPRITEI